MATPQTEPTGALTAVMRSHQPSCRLPALDETERGKQTSLLLRLLGGFMLLTAKLNRNWTHRHLLSPIHGSHGHNLSPRRADPPTTSHPSPSGTQVPQAPPARAHAVARLYGPFSLTPLLLGARFLPHSLSRETPHLPLSLSHTWQPSQIVSQAHLLPTVSPTPSLPP